ncbi:hypothetical protein LZ30DRAFT_744149 [Colletotrichum cereale]|nr:hypothetical protein LZ30DRAFT_744149 [Colletotrichum cereale]
MKSSSGKGACSVCGHLNNVHVRRTCVAKGCKQQIKICGASYHYCLTLDGYDRHQNGDVVCSPSWSTFLLAMFSCVNLKKTRISCVSSSVWKSKV